MTPQLSKILILLGSILLFFFLWVASVGWVYWDIDRRELSQRRHASWMALATFFPLLGAAVYLFFVVRRPRQGQNAARPDPGARHTRPMPVSPGDVYLPTNAYAPGLGDTGELNLTPAMTSILTIQSGPAAGKDFTLRRFPICIGRGPDASVRLDEDRSVSRRHAEIYEKAGRLHIRDLASTHGTQVNGNWTSDQPLEPGDEIQLGSSTLLFQQQEA